MKVNIRVIEHSEQRYPTVGDWFVSAVEGTLEIRVSQIKDKDGKENEWMEHLVALHEYIEALLCLCRGISEQTVTDFDMMNPNSPDPGSLLEAPYYHEHQFATFIEYKMAEQMKLNWEEYDAAVNAL